MIKESLLISTIKRIYSLLPNKYRIRGFKVFFLLLLNSLFEFLGLAAIIPLFSIILREGIVYSNGTLFKIFSFFSFESENNFVLFLSLIIVSVIVFKNIVSLFVYYYQGSFSYSLYKYYATQMHKLYHEKGYLFYKRTNSNSIARDINNVPLQYVTQVLNMTITLVSEIIVLLLILCALLWYNAEIVLLLSIVIVPASYLFYSLVKEKIQFLTEKQHHLQAVTFKSLFQTIFGYSEIEVSNKKQWFLDDFNKHVGEMSKLLTMLHVYRLSSGKVIETAVIASIVLVIAYGIHYLARVDLMVLLGALAVSAYRVLPSINRILFAIMNIKGMQYAFDIFGQLKIVDEETITNSKPVTLKFNNSIRFDKINFQFDDGKEKILCDFDLEIKKGETVGIIGESGSGKTTLINLLLRFYTENSGGIYIDNNLINSDNISKWRDLIGYVPQEIFLLDATLKENIAFGVDLEEIDDVKVIQTLEDANLSEFLQNLSLGINSNIGERGSQISGGQKQRVGIARALYRKPEVLIFDEATSALDSKAEEAINETVAKLKNKGLTMIIIAHRKTSLKECDRIIELKKGMINKIYQYEEI